MGSSIVCLVLLTITTAKEYAAYSPVGDESLSSNLQRIPEDTSRWEVKRFQRSEGATSDQVDSLNEGDTQERKAKREMAYNIKTRPQNSRWGRSAPGSELIGQPETKSEDVSSTWNWPDSSQDDFSRATRATGERPTIRPWRTLSWTPRPWTQRPPTEASTEDPDVYVPFAGQRFDGFDWKLCREMNALAPSNAAVSPVGVKMVLGLLNEVASRRAAAELMRALGLSIGITTARQAFRYILDTLQEKHEGYIMKVANRIYLDKSFKPLKNISDIFDTYYSAPIKQVDFENSTAVKHTINSWVMNFTNGQIPNLITNEHQLHKVISMILNVIYFKGEWLYPFPQKIEEDNFYITPNTTVKVKYMNLQKDLYYGESEKLDAKILRLPYKGKRYSMFIILPNEKGNFDKMLQHISPKEVRTLLHDLIKTNVKVTIPKFKFDFSIELKEILQKVGIIRIFQKSDELNLVTTKTNIGISKVIQKIGFEVNEEGTEASSVVAVELENKWGGTKSFIATHPFLFFIEEGKTGTIVFIGKVVNPVHKKPELDLASAVSSEKAHKSILERDFSDDIAQQKIKNVPITSDT